MEQDTPAGTTPAEIDGYYSDRSICHFHGGISRDTLNRRRKNGEISTPDAVIGGRNLTRASTVRRDLERLAQQHALTQAKVSKAAVDGRAERWKLIRENPELHPRTIGRLKREAARAAEQAGPT
jgi:hypothetical protein